MRKAVMFHSLRFRLFVALMLVIVVTVGTVGIFSSQATSTAFDVYLDAKPWLVPPPTVPAPPGVADNSNEVSKDELIAQAQLDMKLAEARAALEAAKNNMSPVS